MVNGNFHFGSEPVDETSFAFTLNLFLERDFGVAGAALGNQSPFYYLLTGGAAGAAHKRLAG